MEGARLKVASLAFVAVIASLLTCSVSRPLSCSAWSSRAEIQEGRVVHENVCRAWR